MALAARVVCYGRDPFGFFRHRNRCSFTLGLIVTLALGLGLIRTKPLKSLISFIGLYGTIAGAVGSKEPQPHVRSGENSALPSIINNLAPTSGFLPNLAVYPLPGRYQLQERKY